MFLFDERLHVADDRRIAAQKIGSAFAERRGVEHQRIPDLGVGKRKLTAEIKLPFRATVLQDVIQGGFFRPLPKATEQHQPGQSSRFAIHSHGDDGVLAKR